MALPLLVIFCFLCLNQEEKGVLIKGRLVVGWKAKGAWKPLLFLAFVFKRCLQGKCQKKGNYPWFPQTTESFPWALKEREKIVDSRGVWPPSGILFQYQTLPQPPHPLWCLSATAGKWPAEDAFSVSTISFYKSCIGSPTCLWIWGLGQNSNIWVHASWKKTGRKVLIMDGDIIDNCNYYIFIIKLYLLLYFIILYDLSTIIKKLMFIFIREFPLL